MSNDIKRQVAEVMGEIAEAIQTGAFGKQAVVGLTLSGSEHGQEVMREACLQVLDEGFKVALIGEADAETKKALEGKSVIFYPTGSCQKDEHDKMDELLDKGEIDACVTNHYNFPIGVTTVGMVTTPAKGKNLILASTTGTSATHRVEALLRNAVAGLTCAKAVGIERPTLGILNIEGARAVEKALKELKDSGYDFDFAESGRADGGAVMRGNDLLMASPDVMVMDSLTGNLLVKMFSSYSTGGNYEATGFAYGPGIGKDFSRKVLIISRASGAAVIANALRFAAKITRGKLAEVARAEYAAADQAGFERIIEGLVKTKKEAGEAKPAKQVEKEIVTYQLSGIEIMDLDDAVAVLMNEGIYAEAGMGCTGPIILVNEVKGENAEAILKKEGFMQA